MSVEDVLARGRARAETVMIDTCTIDTVTQGTFNPTTGGYDATTTNRYSGRCRLRTSTVAAVSAVERQAGDAQQLATRVALLLPHGAGASVSPGDIATVAGLGTWTVIRRLSSTTATADSFLVEE